MPSKKLIIILISAFIVFIGIIVFLSTIPNKARVFIGQKSFSVDIAETQYLLKKGLSGHAPLEDTEGMLFIFKTVDKHGFWMKDMLFPIDIIWIDENLRIVHIEKFVFPETYPKIFYPNTGSLYVLEIKAGMSELSKFKIGDKVQFTKKWF